ncbi:MAG TPA: TonB-dependent receptor, partial [Bryobacteraceae bacterium]|nr:TonB-dependent receptor [Bryobacteraceae bacterium]
HTYGDQGDAKIDADLTERHRLYGRYSQSRQSSPSFSSFPLTFPSFFEAPARNGVVNWTQTWSPSFVNEIRAGANYVKVNNGGQDRGTGNIAEQLGIQNGNERGPGLFAMNISGGAAGGFGEANIGTQQLFANTSLQVADAAVITRGRHVFHAGGQVIRTRINTFYAGNNGRTGLMDFTGRFTAGPDARAVAGAGAGAGEADFFLGLPDRLGRGVNTGTWGQRSTLFAAYLQDEWRITNALNVNLGLRYETHTPWVEVKDRQANFAPFSGEIQIADQDTIYNNDRALYNSYNFGYNFQPRVGFAWTVNGQMVIRGAFTTSTYLEGTGTNLRLPLNPPFNQEFETRYDTLTLPASRISQGLTVLSSATDPFAGANIRLWDPYIKPALSQQWNFTVQQRLGDVTTVQAGYVGQKGTHLMVPMPYFQRQLLADGTTAPSPYLSGNPALTGITQISGTESNGTMRYDGLQAVFQRRLSSGLQAQVSYAYSKCMTNNIGYYGSGGQSAPASAYWQNLYNSKAEWGPCFFDVTHNLTSYAVWDIPFGRGRAFGRDLHPVLNAVAGNWNVSGILSLRGGFPLTISGGDASGTKSRGPRANCIAPGHEFGTRGSAAGGYQWFDPSPYAPAAPGTFGTCGVGTVRGPGLRTFDMSLQKQFPISERTSVEFRSEFINLTNTPILNAPNSSLGGDLGRITSSQGARNIQFALKLYF